MYTPSLHNACFSSGRWRRWPARWGTVWSGTYDGKWEESLKHGAGKQLYKNGDEYHGTWYQGYPAQWTG